MADDVWDMSEFVDLAVQFQVTEQRVGAEVSAVIRKTAFDIEKDAKVIAKLKDVYDTGDLINSISVDFQGDGRSGSMTAEIGPTVDYAVYQEYGTSDQPPREFLGPAFDRRVVGLDQAMGIIAGRAMG